MGTRGTSRRTSAMVSRRLVVTWESVRPVEKERLVNGLLLVVVGPRAGSEGSNVKLLFHVVTAEHALTGPSPAYNLSSSRLMLFYFLALKFEALNLCQGLAFGLGLGVGVNVDMSPIV